MTLTFNPILANVKVNLHAKYQGQTVPIYIPHFYFLAPGIYQFEAYMSAYIDNNANFYIMKDGLEICRSYMR